MEKIELGENKTKAKRGLSGEKAKSRERSQGMDVMLSKIAERKQQEVEEKRREIRGRREVEVKEGEEIRQKVKGEGEEQEQ